LQEINIIIIIIILLLLLLLKKLPKTAPYNQYGVFGFHGSIPNIILTRSIIYSGHIYK